MYYSEISNYQSISEVFIGISLTEFFLFLVATFKFLIFYYLYNVLFCFFVVLFHCNWIPMWLFSGNQPGKLNIVLGTGCREFIIIVIFTASNRTHLLPDFRLVDRHVVGGNVESDDWIFFRKLFFKTVLCFVHIAALIFT